MKAALFSPRKLFVTTLVGIIVLAVVGWALWSLSAAQYRRVIDGWIEEGRAAGYKIGFDQRQIFGFPRRITMRLHNLHWQDADGIAFQTDDMDITVTPWDWQDFDVKFKNNATLAAPLDEAGEAMSLSAAEGEAHVRLDRDGVWHLAKLNLNHAQAGLAPHYLFAAENLMLSVSRPLTPPTDHTQVGLTLEGEADSVTLPAAMPSPFGDKADRLTAHMRVMGPVPDVRERASVDAWNKDSGIVEFDDFSLNWGVLNIASKGTLGFDDDLQPEGAFVGSVANPAQTFKTLVAGGFIAMHDQDMLNAAMSMFAKPSANGSKNMELPITIQLGGLFFGPIRIFTFPAIDWPVAPPVVKE